MSHARFAWSSPHVKSPTAIVPNHSSATCAARRRPAVARAQKCHQNTTCDATHQKWARTHEDCTEGEVVTTTLTQAQQPPAACAPRQKDTRARRTFCGGQNVQQQIPLVRRGKHKAEEDRSPTPKRVRRCVLCTEIVPKAGLEMDRDNSVVERFVRYRPENDARWYCHANCLRRCIHDGGVAETFLRSKQLKRASSRYEIQRNPRLGTNENCEPNASTRGAPDGGKLTDDDSPQQRCTAKEMIVKGRLWGLQKERQLMRTYQVACANKNAADALRARHLAARLPKFFEMWKEGRLICHLERRRDLARREEVRQCLLRVCAVVERGELACAVAAWKKAPNIRKQVKPADQLSTKATRMSIATDKEAFLMAQKRTAFLVGLANKTRIDLWRLDRGREIFQRFEDESTNMIAQDRFPELLMKLMRAKDNMEIPHARVLSWWRNIDPKGVGQVDFNSFAVWLAQNYRLVASK
eukprot:GEMP01012155.1.p1 GENE.GEMP01012155.1~~GEMP01012155.1.p1  ORF type:complete len:468 (-),score=126.26 GEMP01012155.1:1480-2883(-)